MICRKRLKSLLLLVPVYCKMYVMNEMSATQFLLKNALQQAEKTNAKRITGLHIVIGELSSMTEDLIKSHWEITTRNTIAEHAVLHFRRVPAELQCMTCFGKYHPKENKQICPQCGGVGAKVITGEEFSLEAVDVE